MARPSALGTVVIVQSLEDADLVLAELGYLEYVANDVTNRANARINAIKDEAIGELKVIVDGQPTVIADRMALLRTALTDWIATALLSELKDDKKSIELPHGTIGLRQRPLAIEIEEGKKDVDVIDAFDKASFKSKKSVAGWVGATFARLTDVVKGFGPVSDFLTLKLSLNMTGIKKAYQGKLVHPEALAAIHLKPVEPYDAPFITPNEFTV